MKKGHPEFPPRWPMRKTLRVGAMLGKGRQANDIANVLNDGTSPDTIRRMRRYGRLNDLDVSKGRVIVAVRLTSYQLREISKRARARGLSIDDWIANVAVHAAIPTDLYEAIVPIEETED